MSLCAGGLKSDRVSESASECVCGGRGDFFDRESLTANVEKFREGFHRSDNPVGRGLNPGVHRFPDKFEQHIREQEWDSPIDSPNPKRQSTPCAIKFLKLFCRSPIFELIEITNYWIMHEIII